MAYSVFQWEKKYWPSHNSGPFSSKSYRRIEQLLLFALSYKIGWLYFFENGTAEPCYN